MKKIIFALAVLVSTSTVSYSQTVGTGVGNKAPELNFESPEGKKIALSSLKGKDGLIEY